MLNKNTKVMKNEKVSSKSHIDTNNTFNSIRQCKNMQGINRISSIPISDNSGIEVQAINNTTARYNNKDMKINKLSNSSSNANNSNYYTNIKNKNLNYNKNDIQKAFSNNKVKYSIKNEQSSNISFSTNSSNIECNHKTHFVNNKDIPTSNHNGKYNKTLPNNISTSNINKAMESRIKKHDRNNIAQIVKIRKLSSNATIPTLGTTNSAGYDLVACIDKDISIQPNEFVLVSTGIAMEIPSGYFGMICSRSGLSSKYGIHILNAPGIIDADYRGEIKCILYNCSNNTFTLKNGTKMAQLLIMKHEIINWVETDNLSDTNRGTNGFGSTGI